MNRYITPFLITLFLSIFVIVIFAIIYQQYNKDNSDPNVNTWLNSFYNSVTIQTNIGMAEVSPNEKNGLKFWYIVQSLIAYIITLGLIFFIFKAYFIPEKRLQKVTS